MSTNTNQIICKPSSLVEVKLSDVHFRGVFATQNIAKDQIIEECPIVPLSNRSRYHNDPTIINYVYANKNCDCSECKNHGFIYYMVLGYGMLYNHEENPNAQWKFDYKEFIARLVALKDIEKLQEIFISYGQEHIVNQMSSHNAKNSQ